MLVGYAKIGVVLRTQDSVTGSFLHLADVVLPLVHGACGGNCVEILVVNVTH